LCRSGPFAAATEAGQFTEALQFTEAPQFTKEPLSIAAERWFDEGLLCVAGTLAATAILTTRFAEAAAITVAEFIVAAPLSGAERS
jgi:hypothetical protein